MRRSARPTPAAAITSLSDEFTSDWRSDGIAADAALLYEAGRRLANSREWPSWKAGSEFKQIRDATASLTPLGSANRAGHWLNFASNVLAAASHRSTHSPGLRYRPVTRSDLDECIGMLPPWLDLDADTRQAMPRLWQQLVDEPSVITAVIEDLALPAQRIQAWGVTLIIPQAAGSRVAAR